MTATARGRIRWLAGLAVLAAFALMRAPGALRAEPEIHRRLEPLHPWIPVVDDPAKADSAWRGISALLPTLADSAQRGFGWYLLYCAASSVGHVDSMRVAAESSFVYSPTDPSGFRELSHYLARAGHHLELALACAERAYQVPHQIAPKEQRLEDLRWLGHIQNKMGRDTAAIATFEQHVRESKTLDAWVLYRLGGLYTRNGRADRAIDRYTVGLSTFPQDSTDAAYASEQLDSLLAARGGDVAVAQARIARTRAASAHRYWLEDHRDGAAVPPGAFVDMAGAPVAPLCDARGITVVYAWATWCGPCRRSLPQLQSWAARPRTRAVRVVTVDAEGEPLADSRAKVEKFVSESHLTLPVQRADSAAAARWKLGGFPMTLVLKDGRIVYRGHAGGLVDGLEAQLASLGSRPVTDAMPIEGVTR